MAPQLPMNPAAPHTIPFFITEPGKSDWLMTAMAIFLIVTILSVGLVYLRLHALPEHMAHRTNKVQLQLVGILALLALFTHNHAFWIAALLLAIVELPDFSTPVNSIARSLETLAGRGRPDPEPSAPGNPTPPPAGPLAGDQTPSPAQPGPQPAAAPGAAKEV